jgi:hypothetical protein
MDLSNPINTVANVVMATGALLILWQIRESRLNAITSFEDAMDKEYRELIRRLPTQLMLGSDLTESLIQEHLDEFYYYFDLCNQQAFLRQRKRVRPSTWTYWSDGMRSNFERPAFHRAWDLVKEKAPGDFGELRQLECLGFKSDPAEWDHP